jgi:L-ascorbate metabolism protein UlaG (beta-lactamase superfamily)
MNIQLIRNATIVVEYAGSKFLIDPMLAEKGTLPAFGPAVGLPEAPRRTEQSFGQFANIH